MKKKLVFIALAAAVMLLAPASYASPLIESVSLYIEEPAAGMSPADLSWSFSADAAGALASSSFRWYVEDGGWVEIPQDVLFEAGETYSFDFRGKIAPGNALSPDVSGTVNGLPSDEEYGSTYVSDSEVYLSQQFGPLEGTGEKRTGIKAAELTISEPKEGKTPKDIEISIKTAPEGVGLSYDVYWFEADRPSKNKDAWREIGQDEKFVSGKYYSPDVYVYAPSGFRFKANTAFRVNGKVSNEDFASSFTNSREAYMSTVFGPVRAADPMPFTDVAADAYFADAVVWGFYAEPQVTDGNGKGQFMPEQTCTRGQVVTFLWRAFGCPEPGTAENPFTDVSESDYYYKPVLWAVENGITDGTAPDKFSPETPCRQSHILTFIHRAVGKPGGTASPQSWYSDAYDWAVREDLIALPQGFNIDSPSPRRDVIYYMYRNFAKK